MQWTRARNQEFPGRPWRPPAPAPQESTPVILVVDDDGGLRAAFATVLAGLGLPVVEASGGHEALRLAQEHEVALVVLDNRMPDKSGLEVLCALRARPATARVPVIFVTGVAEVSERVRAFEAGVDDYLVKPVNAEELRARVRSHLSRHQDRVGEEARLRRLASAAAALSRAAAGGSVELIALAACRELSQLHDDVDIALHAFAGEACTDCLAAQRSGSEVTAGGPPLDTDSARRAYERARGGPWVETTHPSLVRGRGPAPVLPGPATTAWVPLSAPGRVLGVIVISAEGFVVEDLLRRVTAAMVAACELAPTITPLLEPGLERRSASEDRRARLQRVISGPSFPVFQPVVDLTTMDVQGYEALTRFEDGTRPQVRLAEAARVGGLVTLDAALCRAALEAAADLPRTDWISVNVSVPLALDTPALREAVSGYAGPPLVLEVNERDLTDDRRALREAMDELGLDVRLSLDDMGHGWSGCPALDLEPTFIKLDPSWLRGLEDDATRQALVRGLSRFAKRTGRELVAEGVETQGQVETLLGLEVKLGQGFLLGRPARPGSAGTRAGVVSLA